MEIKVENGETEKPFLTNQQSHDVAMDEVVLRAWAGKRFPDMLISGSGSVGGGLFLL